MYSGKYINFFFSPIDVVLYSYRCVLALDRAILKVVPESVSSQIRAHPVARSCKSRRSTRVRYRLHLHKAIVFPLLRTRLPRTWRGCHSEFLRTLLSLLSHRSRISTPLYLPLGISSAILLFFLDFKPPCSMQAPTPCRSLPCLHSCILLHEAGLSHYVCVTFAYLFQVKPYLVESISWIFETRIISRDTITEILRIDHHTGYANNFLIFQGRTASKMSSKCNKYHQYRCVTIINNYIDINH